RTRGRGRGGPRSCGRRSNAGVERRQQAPELSLELVAYVLGHSFFDFVFQLGDLPVYAVARERPPTFSADAVEHVVGVGVVDALDGSSAKHRVGVARRAG